MHGSVNVTYNCILSNQGMFHRFDYSCECGASLVVNCPNAGNQRASSSIWDHAVDGGIGSNGVPSMTPSTWPATWAMSWSAKASR
jgi:hypothetical protein